VSFRVDSSAQAPELGTRELKKKDNEVKYWLQASIFFGINFIKVLGMPSIESYIPMCRAEAALDPTA
jgi:hypothetical protein